MGTWILLDGDSCSAAGVHRAGYEGTGRVRVLGLKGRLNCKKTATFTMLGFYDPHASTRGGGGGVRYVLWEPEVLVFRGLDSDELAELGTSTEAQERWAVAQRAFAGDPTSKVKPSPKRSAKTSPK
eukprot:COSAG06_NODE_32710_length_501_cov_2.189055_1_plen_125_part_10